VSSNRRGNMGLPNPTTAGPILSTYMLSAVVYPRIPEPQWQSGPDAIMLGRLLIAFLLPTAAALTYLLLRAIARKDPLRIEESPSARACDAILSRAIAFVLTLHLAILAGLLGRGAWAVPVILVLTGVTLVRIGNLLPRTRPNLVVGWRSARVLASRELWIHTHRLLGYAAVSLGSAIVIAAFLPSSLRHIVVTCTALTAAALLLRLTTARG
jgi:hypothetical protein